MRHVTSVIVVERESLFRRGLRACFEIDRRMCVVASVGSVDEAFVAAATSPDAIIFVGTAAPNVVSIALVRELRRRYPNLVPVVIADSPTAEFIRAARQVGVAAILEKDATETDVVRLVRVVAAGEVVIDDQLRKAIADSGQVARAMRQPRPIQAALDDAMVPISHRELQILRKISSGMTNCEIGCEYGISVQTVKNHVTSILRKLAVNDRTQAVVLAIQQGWLSLDEIKVESHHPPRPVQHWGPSIR